MNTLTITHIYPAQTRRINKKTITLHSNYVDSVFYLIRNMYDQLKTVVDSFFIVWKAPVK